MRGADPRDGCVPLDAKINILNRSFGGRKLEQDLGAYFVLARSMVQAKRENQPSGQERTLCNNILRRLHSITNAHGRASHGLGMRAQYNISSEVVSRLSASPPMTWNGKGPPQSSEVSDGEKIAPRESEVDVIDDMPSFSRRKKPRFFTKTITLLKLLSDFDAMLCSVEATWENGESSTNRPLLKSLVDGSARRQEIKQTQPFGRSSSTTLPTRHAIANAAQLGKGWDESRAVLHTESASREAIQAKFRFNEAHSFCASMVKNALQG